jgi:hypothetical protein
MKSKEVQARTREKKSKLSRHERDQLRSWMNATPLQRLAWLEEAIQLAAKSKMTK